MKKLIFIVGLSGVLLSGHAAPATFSTGASYEICFRPDGASCQDLIISKISHAKKTVDLQAYSFTSAPIAKAIVGAMASGVKVRVILDKSQDTERYSGKTYLMNARVPVWIDRAPKIAHNKVIIIDGQEVFTGSFNFSKAAENSNAENGIVISDPRIAADFSKNFETRLRVSSVAN